MLRTISTSAWAGCNAGQCNAALNAAAPDEHSTGTRNTGFQRLSKPVSQLRFGHPHSHIPRGMPKRLIASTLPKLFQTEEKVGIVNPTIGQS